MIIYHNNRPIKKVPKKYLKIQNLTEHFEDFEYLRLSEVERTPLDRELFRIEAENFLMYLSLTDPLAFEQVKDAKPICAGKIKDANNELCTVLKMSNNMTICCDDSLYSISPEKFRPAKQKITQLKCF